MPATDFTFLESGQSSTSASILGMYGLKMTALTQAELKYRLAETPLNCVPEYEQEGAYGQLPYIIEESEMTLRTAFNEAVTHRDIHGQSTWVKRQEKYLSHLLDPSQINHQLLDPTSDAIRLMTSAAEADGMNEMIKASWIDQTISKGKTSGSDKGDVQYETVSWNRKKFTACGSIDRPPCGGLDADIEAFAQIVTFLGQQGVKLGYGPNEHQAFLLSPPLAYSRWLASENFRRVDFTGRLTQNHHSYPNAFGVTAIPYKVSSAAELICTDPIQISQTNASKQSAMRKIYELHKTSLQTSAKLGSFTFPTAVENGIRVFHIVKDITEAEPTSSATKVVATCEFAKPTYACPVLVPKLMAKAKWGEWEIRLSEIPEKHYTVQAYGRHAHRFARRFPQAAWVAFINVPGRDAKTSITAERTIAAGSWTKSVSGSSVAYEN